MSWMKRTICLWTILLSMLCLPVQAADGNTEFGETLDGFPLHLNGSPNYVFVWGNQGTGDYIKRDSLKLVRHAAPTYYEITVEVAYVGDASKGNTEIASTKMMGFEYSFDAKGRRLLYSPRDLESWLYIDADNDRGMNAERKAIGEMAYYLIFGKPFYGYLADYDSNFYTSSGYAGVRGVALAGSDEQNSFYVCPGTLYEKSDGFSVFVKIGPEVKELKDYIMEFSLMEGIWYYAFYIQNQPPVWQPLAGNQIYQRIWQIANHYRAK